MCFFSFFRIKGLYCFYGLFSFCFWGGVVGLFCWYGSWSFVVLLWVAAGWNGWYSSAKRISCFVGILLLCASIAEIYLPSQIMRKWPAGGCCFAKGRTGVYWFENIFYSGGFSICAYCVGAIFFVYGFGFCFFLFVVGRVVVCSGAAGRGRCMKKKRRGRVSPALEGAATYSPACAVPSAWSGLTSLFGMGRGGALML